MRFSMSAIIYWQNPCKLLISFRCIKAYMLAFSGRFSRKCLEGISFNFFVCFIFDWSIGSAPKKKTSISNGIPELKWNPSLLPISCQCLILYRTSGKHGFAKVQENLNGCPITHNWTNQRMEAIGDWHPLDFLHTFFR